MNVTGYEPACCSYSLVFFLVLFNRTALISGHQVSDQANLGYLGRESACRLLMSIFTFVTFIRLTAGVEQSLLKSVKRRKLTYFGHVMRKEGECLDSGEGHYTRHHSWNTKTKDILDQ